MTVSISYGPGPLADGIMTLTDVATGLRVSFRVSAVSISEGAEIFEVRLLAPAMVALDRRVSRCGLTDFPPIAFKSGATSG